MYELTIESQFNATHSLLMPDGAREPVHGHDWLVRVVVAADDLNEHDWVMDFHALEASLESVLKPLQHAALNDHEVVGAANPSAEVVARFIAHALVAGLPDEVSLKCVSVTEAPGCIATYRPA